MKSSFFSNVDHFRCERKFSIDSPLKEDVELMLQLHPAMFSKIYHQRRVNNIYLDSLDLHNYFDNINGLDKRLKIRIRWYGDLFGLIKKPVLELKLKHNLHVGKLLYPLKPFALNKEFSLDLIQKVLKQSDLSENLLLHLTRADLSLLNSYQRKYFLSADRNYRATVDWEMQAYRLFLRENQFLHQITDHETIILELKYNKLQDQLADRITNHFPVRIAKSSKYIDGLMKLNIW
ncbi:MAG: VTC domain-containing protein [Candidatus Omnitrophota bacterium]